jgi:hypothetical protein
VRDAAAHLVAAAGVYCELVNGATSPIDIPPGNGPAFRDAATPIIRQLLSDIPEGDPATLAGLVIGSSARLLDTTAERPGDQPVPFHCGVHIRLAEALSIMVGEYILHGYDMATAVGRPWPIDREHAALVLEGYVPIFGMFVNPSTARGVTAAYEIDLRGAGREVVRFVDGEYRLDPADAGPVDCVISADPVAYLLVTAGRLSQWPAISLGLISAGGRRPELALGFGDLFVYP